MTPSDHELDTTEQRGGISASDVAYFDAKFRQWLKRRNISFKYESMRNQISSSLEAGKAAKARKAKDE